MILLAFLFITPHFHSAYSAYPPPTQLSLTTNDEAINCIAIVLTSTAVLTAAHCVGIPASDLAVTGTYVDAIDVQSVNTHPLYTPSQTDYDIATLTLRSSLDMTNITTAVLATSAPSIGSLVSLAGGSPTLRNLLQQGMVVLPIDCSEVISPFTMSSDQTCISAGLDVLSNTCEKFPDEGAPAQNADGEVVAIEIRGGAGGCNYAAVFERFDTSYDFIMANS